MNKQLAGEKMGCVYLIWQEGTDLYKIGMTNGDPKARLSQIQCGNPSRLELLCTLECSSPEAKEQELHSQWTEYRVQGEWFKIHPAMLNELFGSFGHYFRDPVFCQVGQKLGSKIAADYHKGVLSAVESTSLALLKAISETDSTWISSGVMDIVDDLLFEKTARIMICDLYEEMDRRKQKPSLKKTQSNFLDPWDAKV